MLNHFFGDFTTQLATAEKDPEEGGMQPNPMVLTSIDCPTCGRKMGIRTASTGVFLGCSGYALPPKERCKTTINPVPENEVLNVLEGDDAETNALRAKRRCQKCGTAMDSYLIDPKRKLHVCGNNPTCDGYEIEEGEFRIKGYDGPVVECEKCGSEMHLKMGRFGKYMACTNDECKNTRKILRNGEVAPPKEDPVPLPELPCEKSDAYFVLRDGAAGVFTAANTFRNHGKRVRRWWRNCTASAIVCRKNCVISPMRRSRIRKAIKRWYALAVKPSSSTWRPKKRAKRPAGQLSLSTVSGRKPKSNGVRSGRKSALFLLRRPAERVHFSAVSSSLFALISSPYNHLYYFSLASIQC